MNSTADPFLSLHHTVVEHVDYHRISRCQVLQQLRFIIKPVLTKVMTC